MTKAGSLIQRARERAAQMPYRPFSSAEISALEHALRLCWREVLAEQRGNLGKFKEEDFSSCLVDVMGTLVADPTAAPQMARFKDFFRVAVSDAAYPDYMNLSKKKRPDFAFYPIRNPEPGVNPRFWCFFVEAKIIDRTRTMGIYAGDSGLKRFICGGYAWSMSQGMMLGYRRLTDQELPNTLNEHFGRDGKQEELAIKAAAAPWPLSRARGHHSRVHVSEHDRNFAYPDSKTEAGPITIFHLWLTAE